MTGSPGQPGLWVTGLPGHWVTGSQNVTRFHVCSFVRSFHQGWRLTVSSLSTCLQLPPALRPRHGPVRNSPLTWGLYYIFIEPSLAGGFLWQSAVCGPPIGPLAPAICYPHRRLSPHPDAPDPGVITCHSLTRTCPIIISCRNLTRHASRGGIRTHALPNNQPGFYCTAARDR